MPPGIIDLLRQRHEAAELVRKQQQGLGRPIVSAQLGDQRIVVVGNTVHTMDRVKFPADFLGKYMKTVMGVEWAKEELAKPLELRHLIMQWAESYREFQLGQVADAEGNFHAEATGIVVCYLGLVYDLFLLAHNVELQARLVARLRDPKQFQGAYYELIVANILIRAGFELVLENEADDAVKHCEFRAKSKATGKTYWVEAKMRSVAGVLGKTEVDGASKTSKPTGQLAKHVRQALEKPAAGDRLIFVDVNAPPEELVVDTVTGEPEIPTWIKAAVKQMDDREKDLREDQSAYVFVTNTPYHWEPESSRYHLAAIAYGLGIPDFGKPGEYRLPEILKRKQKHIDAHHIMDAVKSYPNIPSTFDGSLPLSKEDREKHVDIGNTYVFVDKEGHEAVGKVTAAHVVEEDKKLLLGVTTPEGTSHIVSRPMSDRELTAYQTHRDAYFGVVQPADKKLNSPAELFESLAKCYSETPHARLLEWCQQQADYEELKKLSRDELVLALCERWMCSIVQQDQQRKAEREQSHQESLSSEAAQTQRSSRGIV